MVTDRSRRNIYYWKWKDVLEIDTESFFNEKVTYYILLFFISNQHTYLILYFNLNNFFKYVDVSVLNIEPIVYNLWAFKVYVSKIIQN